jgi:trans-aconitate 3-methyltransferase
MNKPSGQATTELSRFKRIIAVDPSAGMLDSASKHVAEVHGKTEGDRSWEFVESPAEDLKFLEDGTVDLVIAGL